ncbi:MAG TPA: peptide ABC transporter substrate-binding protein [Gaiellaceae bacterium]|nr:peptide ABC transporter substrate-binding protein [Gaiellaceae bacterium]
MTRRTIWPVALVAGVLALVAVGCGGGDDEAAGDNDQVITVNWGTEPPSLDPGLATDTTSSSILLNLMDPLVLLDEALEPVPSIAESWDVTNGGSTVTYHLRADGRWTNGDPVTAQDYEWSWKRTISPALAADYAYQFFGIVGAQAYNTCESNCNALRDKVGITAVDDRTLRVELTSPQPWFVQQSAHTSFLAVHRPTVERYGDNWTEPANIVTNGPFRLERWQHNSRIDLVKWDAWRNAAEIALERVNGRMIDEGLTAVQAFEAGEIDATVGGLPPEELPRLKDTDGYAQYPSLGTYYYGINVENVPDVNQRRAMALAIDRRAIIDNIAQADQLPATGFTPRGMPGFETLNPGSEYLAENGDLERARELMDQVENPARNVTLVINDAPGHREIAVAIQDMWRELGLDTEIRQQEWAQFLESIGPPPRREIDAFRLGWIADYVDAMNFLELWTCDSGNNSTNYCNPEYDQLVETARRTFDDERRSEIYGRLEEILFGSDGDVPIIPIYWYTFVQLEDPSIKDTFGISQTGQIDLRGVVEGDAGGADDV